MTSDDTFFADLKRELRMESTDSAIDGDQSPDELVVPDHAHRNYSLDALLDGITRDNRHGEQDFGEPMPSWRARERDLRLRQHHYPIHAFLARKGESRPRTPGRCKGQICNADDFEDVE